MCPLRRSATVPAHSVASAMCKRFLARLRGHVVTGSPMRRLRLTAVGIIIVTVGSIVSAQKKHPAFSAADLDRAMKTVGVGFELVKRSVANADAENAKDYLARVREQLATTITFWRRNEKDDAVTMLRAALKHMDELDPALAAESVQPTEVNRYIKQVEASCEACHAVYREQDPVTKAFQLKARSVE